MRKSFNFGNVTVKNVFALKLDGTSARPPFHKPQQSEKSPAAAVLKRRIKRTPGILLNTGDFGGEGGI